MELNSQIRIRRPIVNSAEQLIQATAEQSGTSFRISHGDATFFLPEFGLEPGEIEFFVTFIGDTLPNGKINGGSVPIEHSDLNVVSEAVPKVIVGPVFPFLKYHLEYNGETWSSTVIVP